MDMIDTDRRLCRPGGARQVIAKPPAAGTSKRGRKEYRQLSYSARRGRAAQKGVEGLSTTVIAPPLEPGSLPGGRPTRTPRPKPAEPGIPRPAGTGTPAPQAVPPDPPGPGPFRRSAERPAAGVRSRSGPTMHRPTHLCRPAGRRESGRPGDTGRPSRSHAEPDRGGGPRPRVRSALRPQGGSRDRRFFSCWRACIFACKTPQPLFFLRPSSLSPY